MRRRANGEGTLRERADGRWECQVSTANGRRRSVYGRTQKAVLEKRTEALRAIAIGVDPTSSRQTVSDYFGSFLEAKRSRVRRSTWARYETHVRLDILPVLGAVQLAKLGPQHLEHLYVRLLDARKAPQSVRRIHALIHHALAQAMRRNLLVRNVAELVDPPRVARREMLTLTEIQVRQFLQAATQDRFEALYVLALTTGLRQGELLALRWSDLQLDNAMLQVLRTLTWGPGGWTFGEPKTSHSRRRIELSVAAVAAFRRHRAAQLKQRLVAVGAYQDLGLVFATEIGTPIEPSNLTRRSFRPLLAASGCPIIRFHDLRHTAATIALSRGIHPKVVSEMLGHSTVAVTLDVYSHVLPTMQREAAAIFDAILGAAG